MDTHYTGNHPLSIKKGRAVLYRDFVTILWCASMQYITKLATSQSQKPWAPSHPNYYILHPINAPVRPLKFLLGWDFYITFAKELTVNSKKKTYFDFWPRLLRIWRRSGQNCSLLSRKLIKNLVRFALYLKGANFFSFGFWTRMWLTLNLPKVKLFIHIDRQRTK